ncbi:MAG: large repetitive protein, partial [Frankiaceae bacterium]|nr:large repetitive protein [Frankiaceae bacterium]
AMSLSTASADTSGTGTTTVDYMSGKPGPTLTSPADSRGGETNPMPHVVLTWDAVPGADHYVIQMSPNEDWTNNRVTLPDGGTTVATTYEVTVTLPYASYFWRVEALDAAGHHTEWSADRVFFHEWPTAPVITQYPTATNPQFSWTPVQFASGYVLEVTTSGGYGTGEETHACFTNHTSVTPYKSTGPEEKTMGNCFTMADVDPAGGAVTVDWRVRAVDGTTESAIAADTAARVIETCDSMQRTCGPWTYSGTSFAYTPPAAAGAVTAPTGVVTSCGGPTCNDTPTFSWNPVAGATQYEVVVSLDGLYLNLQRQYFVDGNTLTPRDSFFDNQAGQSYHWSVLAIAGSHDVTVVSIDTTNGKATLSQGGVQATGTVGGTLFGGTVQIVAIDTTSPIPTVTIKVGNAKSSALPIDGVFTVPGTNSAWTAGPNFAKRSAPVALSSPADGAIVNTNEVTFSWNDYLATGGAPTEEAMEYRVQVATDPHFDNVVAFPRPHEGITDHVQFTRPDAFFDDGKYYWRVQAYDQSGHDLTWSATRTFIKDSQPPIAKLREPLELAGYNFIDFSEAVTGVSASSVGLAVASTGAHVAGTVFALDAKHATFIPSVPLTAGDSYIVWVTSGVKDLVGNGGIPDPTIVPAPLVADSGGSNIEEDWATNSNAAATGNAYVVASTAGDQITVPFTGNSFAVYGTRNRDGGYATVTIDGASYGTVSFFATSRQWQRRVFAVSGLGTGFHHASIVVTGKAPATSTGRVVAIDGFRSAAGYFEENAPQVMQWWSKRRATDAYHGDYDMTSFALAGSTGAHPTSVVYVKGASVSVIGCKSPDAGKVNVVLNGSVVATIDMYQSYTSCGKRLFVHGLNGSRQSVKLVATGTHNSRSTGYRVTVDAIKVSQ